MRHLIDFEKMAGPTVSRVKWLTDQEKTVIVSNFEKRGWVKGTLEGKGEKWRRVGSAHLGACMATGGWAWPISASFLVVGFRFYQSRNCKSVPWVLQDYKDILLYGWFTDVYLMWACVRLFVRMRS